MIKRETGIETQLVRSRGGAFEVSLDGDLIYSKLRSGQFPDQREIHGTIWERDPEARPG